MPCGLISCLHVCLLCTHCLRLALNGNKSEAILFGSVLVNAYVVSRLSVLSPLLVLRYCYLKVLRLLVLGVTLDSTLCLKSGYSDFFPFVVLK